MLSEDCKGMLCALVDEKASLDHPRATMVIDIWVVLAGSLFSAATGFPPGVDPDTSGRRRSELRRRPTFQTGWHTGRPSELRFYWAVKIWKPL